MYGGTLNTYGFSHYTVGAGGHVKRALAHYIGGISRKVEGSAAAGDGTASVYLDHCACGQGKRIAVAAYGGVGEL